MLGDLIADDVFGNISPSASSSGQSINKFILGSSDYASDQIVRIMASMMYHATVGKEFRDGLLAMNYTIKHPHKFLNAHVAFSLSLMQVITAFYLEVVFVIYIQNIASTINITKDFIAI